jgi:hypothetical protein
VVKGWKQPKRQRRLWCEGDSEEERKTERGCARVSASHPGRSAARRPYRSCPFEGKGQKGSEETDTVASDVDDKTLRV